MAACALAVPPPSRRVHRRAAGGVALRSPVEIAASSRAILSIEHPPVLAERIRRIREAIDRGAYDDSRRLDIALDRMIDSVLEGN